jgi:hypothetical protein
MGMSPEQYSVVASRRASCDSLMWQSPVLSLTAQSFLFTIALGSDSTGGARLVSASLALVASLASMQLMAKSRLHEVRDSRLLEEYERDNDNDCAVVHGKPEIEHKSWYHFSSYKAWMCALAAFAAAAVLILVSVLAGWGWFSATG